MEKEWAYDIKAKESGLTEKQEYERRMERKEKDLIADLRGLGEDSLEELKERHKSKILYKLVDTEQEQAEQEMLDRKGAALKELLNEL